MSLDIRPAGPDDIEVVADILAESSAWLRSKGITQWPERFPRDLVMLAAERGELYVAVSGDEIMATAALQWSDPAFWGEREDAGSCTAWPCAGATRASVKRRSSGRSSRSSRTGERTCASTASAATHGSGGTTKTSGSTGSGRSTGRLTIRTPLLTEHGERRSTKTWSA
ncbi:MAG: hypothetical protein ACYDBS_11155, partial [Acidimicrobiales bacterium]